MMELTINNQVYEFHFGFGFLKEMNRRVSVPLDGIADVKKNIGLQYAVASLIDGDVEQLADVLDAANKGCSPRLTRTALENYLESVEDIDKVFNDVLDFLKTANCCKRTTLALLAEAERQQAKS